ncbi:uncharacterized protein MCYG_06200 [Microsporum canis CBS 113480]|uniref:Uncharacterized protein n=1 Tax=Arthroderma otae (strain ATCC MYA-4605 / CBS 113480) TaxID=554155 RepID=C5FTZ7_ARTOC|nr:uncharacterized protein MCYG_06200 [Microsporum canis CBS 113480]EEQ33381.1 predicted protein [Microsporum canis CBS 113480]
MGSLGCWLPLAADFLYCTFLYTYASYLHIQDAGRSASETPFWEIFDFTLNITTTTATVDNDNPEYSTSTKLAVEAIPWLQQGESTDVPGLQDVITLCFYPRVKSRLRREQRYLARFASTQARAQTHGIRITDIRRTILLCNTGRAHFKDWGTRSRSSRHALQEELIYASPSPKCHLKKVPELAISLLAPRDDSWTAIKSWAKTSRREAKGRFP